MSGERAGTTQHWPGKSGLSDLSRAQRRDHRELAQQQVHAAQVVFSRNLHALKSERSCSDSNAIRHGRRQIAAARRSGGSSIGSFAGA